MTRTAHAAVSCVLLCALGALVSAQGPVKYIYDELGRLVGVVDVTGNSAVYAYDAVGNLLSITRFVSTDVAIIEFTPDTGPVGTAVTIYGSGFSTTPAQNTVQFNGTTATVTAATSTSLLVTVPSGATTGTISVTVSATMATSGAAFGVTANLAPSISSFTPTIGHAGTAVTVSGSNFDGAALTNRLKFNATIGTVSSSTATSIVTTVPSASGGRIRVSTPAGEAVSTDDFFIPPSPYAAADVQHTSRMTFTDSKAVNLTTGGKIGLVLFDGTAGQRTSMKVVPGVVSDVVIYRPDGAALASVSGSTTRLIEPPLLPATGTYSTLVDFLGSSTGTTTITLYAVPADVTGTLTAGGASQAVTMSTPGQNARLTFTGAVDQRISLRVSSGPVGSTTIQNPDGSALTSVSVGPVQGFIDTRTLSAAGTYGVFVNPGEASTGTVTLTLYDVPADVEDTITPGGGAVGTSYTTPGQNGRLTFSGTTNQRVSLRISGGPISTVTMKHPDGSTLASASSNVLSTFIDTKTLSNTGTHAIAIDPHGANTGTLTFTLYDVPADVTGTLTVGGAAVPVTITTAGQNGSLTFSGTQGQQVTVRMTSNSVSNLNVKLLKPDGSQLASATSSSSSFNLATQTLPTTGTYTVTLDPAQWNTGSVTVQVTTP